MRRAILAQARMSVPRIGADVHEVCIGRRLAQGLHDFATRIVQKPDRRQNRVARWRRSMGGHRAPQPRIYEPELEQGLAKSRADATGPKTRMDGHSLARILQSGAGPTDCLRRFLSTRTEIATGKRSCWRAIGSFTSLEAADGILARHNMPADSRAAGDSRVPARGVATCRS